MEYLQLFNTENEYLNFKTSDKFIFPNVSLITETNTVFYYKLLPPISLCDVAYYDGNSIKTVKADAWNSSLGTPVGVVVIPEGFLPDGKARMIGLKPVNKNGDASSSHVGMSWGNFTTDTSLTNFNRVPITDNKSSATTSSHGTGHLPSDKLTGAQSYVDAKAKYDSRSSNLIPSPYLDDETMNPAYSATISGYNNMLSDFNGLSNTQTLVGLGSDYEAANASWKYNDGVSSTQWYLPAIGELSFLMPRFNAINEVISSVGGVAVINDYLWSSSEGPTGNACILIPTLGDVTTSFKGNGNYVRPFGLV